MGYRQNGNEVVSYNIDVPTVTEIVKGCSNTNYVFDCENGAIDDAIKEQLNILRQIYESRHLSSMLDDANENVSYNGYPHNSPLNENEVRLPIPDGHAAAGGYIVVRIEHRVHHTTDMLSPDNTIVVNVGNSDSFAGDVLALMPPPPRLYVPDEYDKPLEPGNGRSSKAKKFAVRGGKMVSVGQYPSFMVNPKRNKKKRGK